MKLETIIIAVLVVTCIVLTILYINSIDDRTVITHTDTTLAKKLDSIQSHINIHNSKIDSLRTNETLIKNYFNTRTEIIQYLPDSVLRKLQYETAREVLK